MKDGKGRHQEVNVVGEFLPVSQSRVALSSTLQKGDRIWAEEKPTQSHSEPQPGLRPPGQSTSQQIPPGHLSQGFVPREPSELRLGHRAWWSAEPCVEELPAPVHGPLPLWLWQPSLSGNPPCQAERCPCGLPNAPSSDLGPHVVVSLLCSDKVLLRWEAKDPFLPTLLFLQVKQCLISTSQFGAAEPPKLD